MLSFFILAFTLYTLHFTPYTLHFISFIKISFPCTLPISAEQKTYDVDTNRKVVHYSNWKVVHFEELVKCSTFARYMTKQRKD